MKIIIFVLMFLSMTCLVSAEVIPIIAGENYTFTLEEEYVYYNITGNLTPINLSVYRTGDNVTIQFGKYIQNETFEIVFYNEQEEIITPSKSQSGGSSNSQKETNNTITYNYKCKEWGEWSECKDKSQVRYCSNIVLANESSELSQSRTCKVEDNITDIIDNDIVVDDVGPTNNKIIYIILGVLFFLLVIGIVIYVINRFRGEREPEENEIINPQQN